MYRAFEVLEERGFISEEDLPKFADTSVKDTGELYETLYSTILSIQYPRESENEDDSSEKDPFSFMASASIRADSGCQELGCRMQKLDFLARFSALYATKVSLPLHLIRPENVPDIDQMRRYLYLSGSSLFALRPLIEDGLITPVTMSTMHCEHVNAFIHEMTEFVHAMASWGAKESSDLFSITYQLPEYAPSGRATVYIDGPEEFLDHGNIVGVFDEPSSFRAKSWRFDREGKIILKGKRKLLFLEQIFDTIANDTTFYLASGNQHRARLLTDRPGDAFLLNWLNQDDELQTASTAMELLNHSVPLLADIPISVVLRIRHEERESFEAYRKAITALTKDVMSEGVHSFEEVQDAFKTKLEPQIEQVKAEITAERSRQARRLAIGISSAAAAVLIGAWGGLPILVKGALAATSAAVGTKMLSNAAESICEHGVDLRQKNDLYFLVRLLRD